MARKRAGFLTIGQSPRPDILGEMRPWWSDALEVEEFGALDGLSPHDIRALFPKEGDERLVSRLSDGSEVSLSADWVHGRIRELVSELGRKGYDFLVLLCTGKFDELERGCLLLESQAVVDHGVAALAAGASSLGVLLPHEAQRASFHYEPPKGCELLSSHASPYSGSRFARAAGELAAADLIVMHCMGYTEAMRDEVAKLSGKPVLLARRMVASAVAQIV